MPMHQVRKAEAISKTEFHNQLRHWLTTGEYCIGPEELNYKRTGWVFVRDGNSLYQLNADTKRPAVEEYVQYLDLLGDDVEWHVVENRNGNLTAVAYGPEPRRNPAFYLYFVENVS